MRRRSSKPLAPTRPTARTPAEDITGVREATAVLALPVEAARISREALYRLGVWHGRVDDMSIGRLDYSDQSQREIGGRIGEVFKTLLSLIALRARFSSAPVRRRARPGGWRADRRASCAGPLVEAIERLLSGEM